MLVFTVQQNESAIHTHLSTPCGLPSHSSHNSALRRVPSAIWASLVAQMVKNLPAMQQTLVPFSRFSLVTYFIHSINRVCVNANLPSVLTLSPLGINMSTVFSLFSSCLFGSLYQIFFLCTLFMSSSRLRAKPLLSSFCALKNFLSLPCVTQHLWAKMVFLSDLEPSCFSVT